MIIQICKRTQGNRLDARRSRLFGDLANAHLSMGWARGRRGGFGFNQPSVVNKEGSEPEEPRQNVTQNVERRKSDQIHVSEYCRES